MTQEDYYGYTDYKSWSFAMGLFETCYIITGDERFDIDEYNEMTHVLKTYFRWVWEE